MARSNPPSGVKALVLALRLFCLVPFLTGIADLLGGTWILQQAGAAIPRDASLDPILNNQIAFWGAIWFGYGVALWWTSGDPLSRASVARILLGTLFLSGLARGYSLLLYGFPGPVLGAPWRLNLGCHPLCSCGSIAWARRGDRLVTAPPKRSWPAE